ncbi:MAG: hypothetical protein JNK23_08080 [Opitutaceae bacterium]|nr:hypothetical protein [Opitutaceae bacterium]
MTRDTLAADMGKLADAVLSDARWQRDDLGVSVLGMLLYGFALAKGRIVMLLDLEDINAAVLHVMTTRIGAASKWSSGMIEDADRSALDAAYHPGQHELISAGQSYLGIQERAAILDNVFANIRSVRRRADLGRRA